MGNSSQIIADLLTVLTAGLVAGAVCKRIGVSLLVGYLLVGACIDPSRSSNPWTAWGESCGQLRWSRPTIAVMGSAEYLASKQSSQQGDLPRVQHLVLGTEAQCAPLRAKHRVRSTARLVELSIIKIRGFR